MHLHFEDSGGGRQRLRCDSTITSLSWMGRVPDEQPEGHGWKLNRTSYYQEGWLATGSLKSVVGVTFTTTLLPSAHAANGVSSSTMAAGCPSQQPAHLPLPPRTNYNLRGHRAQISLVRWNEPYQKLATCDASGIIFVWIRYEGRWSIELINDRNTPVTHFSWSHDGRMAVIAYQDGFVLVGSVAGQRYWSTILSQDLAITTGTWTPDDQQVYLGTNSGVIVVLDVHNGAVIAQIQMAGNQPGSSSPAGQQQSNAGSPNGIRQLAWNCPRFKMEEPTPSTAVSNPSSSAPMAPTSPASSTQNPLSGLIEEQQHVLAVLTTGGRLSLIKSFDDVQQFQHHPAGMGTNTSDESGCNWGEALPTQFTGAMMEWSNDGELLCLAGHYVSASSSYVNVLQFYNSRGVLRFRATVPYTQAPITSLTWGHNDRRLFVATGSIVHVAWVSPRRMATLQHLARLRLRRCLSEAAQLDGIGMPRLLRQVVMAPLFNSTVHCPVPEEERMREYVCKPPAGNTRLYCTMIRRTDRSYRPAHTTGGNSGGSLHHNQENHLANGELLDGGSSSSNEDGTAAVDPPAADNAPHESGVAFTLYLEFLGGLIPLLKGKPTSRLRPDFIICDPYHQPDAKNNKLTKGASSATLPGSPKPSSTSRFGQFLSPAVQRKFRRNHNNNNHFIKEGIQPMAGAGQQLSDSDETDESCVSTPRLRRRKLMKTPQAPISAPGKASDTTDPLSSENQAASSPLLAQVASNIWGTKFKITGMSPGLPSHLGQVTYKTSLLHLQPRQMTLGVVDLRDPGEGPANDGCSGSDPSAASSCEEEDANQQSEGEASSLPVLASVAPTRTPNLRLRRRACPATVARLPEPPPSPTHQRRRPTGATNASTLLDETIRVEWTEADREERIVLTSPVRLLQWRSFSMDGIRQASSRLSTPKRRKSRSLDSSPVAGTGLRHYNLAGRASHNRPGTRRSWALQPHQIQQLLSRPSTRKTTKDASITQDNAPSPTTFRSTRIGSQPQPDQPQQNGTREKPTHQRLMAAGLARLSPLFGRKFNGGRCSEPSSPGPSSPAAGRRINKQRPPPSERHSSPLRQLLNSPLLARRLGRGRFGPSANPTTAAEDSDDSDDDFVLGGRNTSASSLPNTTAGDYRDLESFQKAQLLNKLRQTWTEENAATKSTLANKMADEAGDKGKEAGCRRRREFVLTNKAPLWNEHSQVYQLDFGGRVTQESAKNFQIEFKGKQVMQFGRIDGNAYTLDFQYPFSAVQAFAVALANVTQRLK